ncbi:MAG: hypothetical protein K0S80_2846 [Neobacillus sp.]|nr:hypothetical protein [Neobacillus sp.]
MRYYTFFQQGIFTVPSASIGLFLKIFEFLFNYSYLKHLQENQALVDLLKKVTEQKNATLAQIALA